jgi:type VI secretion system secreted protein Hcp
MGFQGYVTIKGQSQGQFKGEGTAPKRKDKWIPISSFEYEVVSPRDAATGHASGKRQHKPVTVVKEWGAATPQIFTALTTNETLPEVELEFLKTNAQGEQYVFQKIKLTNATIARLHQFTGAPEDAAGGTAKHTATPAHAQEAVSFVFQKIEIENVDGKTTAQDDWQL